MILDKVCHGVLDQEKGRLIVYEEPAVDVGPAVGCVFKLQADCLPLRRRRMQPRSTRSSRSAWSSMDCTKRWAVTVPAIRLELTRVVREPPGNQADLDEKRAMNMTTCII